MLHLCAVSHKTGRSLTTVKITVVLGRLGAPVSLTLHLSWRWRMQVEIGLGRRKNQRKTESKVASLKTHRLSQFPIEYVKEPWAHLPPTLCRCDRPSDDIQESESVSTRVGAYRGLARVLKSKVISSKLKSKVIICIKLWYAPNPGSKEIFEIWRVSSSYGGLDGELCIYCLAATRASLRGQSEPRTLHWHTDAKACRLVSFANSEQIGANLCVSQATQAQSVRMTLETNSRE